MPEREEPELAEELERDRPVAAYMRVTGRVTRTGTQLPRKVTGRDREQRVAKWRQRES